MPELTQPRVLALGFGWVVIVNLVGVLAFRNRLHANADLPPAAQSSIAPLLLVWAAVIVVPLVLLALAYRAQRSPRAGRGADAHVRR